MRTSRDVIRPLAALLVVVAAIALVSNVAAYRAATTTRHDVASGPHAAAQSADGRPSAATRREREERRERRAEGDHDGDRDGGYASGRDSDGGAVVVTASGAS
ncbi:MAG: hypothetical protein ABEJ82_03200 [Haloplanus sp.]